MRMILSGAVVAGFLLALNLPAFAAPKSDAAAQVRAAFLRYDDGWRTYNVEETVAAFADDFDWVNPVGMDFKDKAAMRRFLTRIFADAAFRAGKAGPTEVESVRVMGEVAVVLSRQRTDGQINAANNQVVKTLYTDEITVFHRVRGHWLIVSDLSADEASGI